MIDQLKSKFPMFISKIELSDEANPENILPGVTEKEIEKLESQLGIQLPESYKRFIEATRGFWLFGGSVQFGSQHPFVHDFPKLEELSSSQRKVLKVKGGVWPPPSQGMLCFAEYFRDADGDQVLFDVSEGLVNGEYPVMYYSHESHPPTIERLANSFTEWLNTSCIDDIA